MALIFLPFIISFAVCSSIYIDGMYSYNVGLRECTIIRGSLQIAKFGNGSEEYYTKLTFPKLREISEFLLVYELPGLRSLANIFPSLSVIQGQKLFNGNALVIHDMRDLEEVGLLQLRVIQSGAVSIKGNPQLCYVDTIDWTAMSRDLGCPRDVITMNRDANECVDVCPLAAVGVSSPCPVRQVQHQGQQWEQLLCWNNQHCQIGEQYTSCI